jgi:dihydroorotate dehydrogenase
VRTTLIVRSFDDSTPVTTDNQSEVGGLSGKPIKPYSLKALQILRAHLPASVPLIGCGGISTGKDALDYAKAGACMVQVFTSFGYDGVGACRRIKDQLVDELVKEGKTWEQVVDEAVGKLSLKEVQSQEPKENDVQQLILEAQELKALLDHVGQPYT